MAFVNSKSLLSLSALLKIFMFSLLLQQYHNANSQPSSPPAPNFEAVNFGFSSFDPTNPNIVLLGNASISGGILSLTKTDPQGKPLQNSAGRAVHVTPVHIWDKNSGSLADFSAGFTFVVNAGNSAFHGDGFAFFLAGAHLDMPTNSSGGYLGLFSPDTAFDPTKNQILAIEFDSFTNEWDPNAPNQSPHVGIDVGSIKSVATTAWPIESVPGEAIAAASINYNSESKRLSLFMSYPGTGKNATVSYVVDLRTVLPEYVNVGFSAATGGAAETHDILSFGFEAAL